MGDLLPQSLWERVRDQLGDRLRRKWLQAKCDRPADSQLAELRSSHAQHENGSVPRKERQVLDQVEEGLFGPLQVVEDANQRRLACALLEQLTEAPGDLLGRRGLLDLAEQRTERARCIGL